MESEQQHYELRSRSRSRSQTPLVQNRVLVEPEISEHHYDLRSRSQERSHTPGETGSNKKLSPRVSLSRSIKAGDQSMETIIEKKEEVLTEDSLLEDQNHRLGNFSVTADKKGERRSERQRGKKQIFANGQSDRKEDISRERSERKHKNTLSHQTITSDYSSEEGEREDMLTSRPNSAHEIYKQAGDWWNVFPKTDYTYSQQSQCRYEIAPGVLAMPNMSRRSIHSDSDSTNRISYGLSESGINDSGNIEGRGDTQNCTSIDEHHKQLSAPYTSNCDANARIQHTKRHVEQYRNHREVIYSVPRNSQQRQLHYGTSLSSGSSRNYNFTSSVDSDTELEETEVDSSRRLNIIQRYISFTTIVLRISKMLEFLKLKTVRRREHRSYAEYQRYEHKWYKVWQYINYFLQYVYLFMVRILLFDSWLLSQVSNVRGWVQNRGPKIFWIALLPLLLLTGTYVVQKQSYICLDSLYSIAHDITETSCRILNNITDLISFNNNSIVKYLRNLQNLQIQSLPSANVSLPEMPSIGWNV